MEDGGKARKLFLDADTNYFISILFRYLDTFPRPAGIPEWPQTLPAITPDQLDAAIAAGEMAIGSPEEVAKCVERYVATGADQLSFGMLSTSLSLETCQEGVETFGKHILPEFDKDPVHNTTKQRLASGGK